MLEFFFMETREKILHSAKELFSKKGYHNTTVEEIVRHAGLSKGAFYFYFKSKEELFKHLIENVYEEIVRKLSEWEKNSEEKEEAIIGFVLELGKKLYEEKEIVDIFLFHMVAHGEEFRNLYFQKTSDLKRRIKALMKSEELGEDEADILTDILMGFLRQMVLEYILKETKPLEFIREKLRRGTEILLRGVRV